MTVREQILQQLLSDITKITITNSYTHDAPAPFNNLQAIVDASVLPVISVVLGPDESELNEYRLDTNLKAYIITRFKTDTDVAKEGLITNEAELWFRDYEELFRRPVSSDVTLDHISRLWDLDSDQGGVDFYYISAKEPFVDDAKDNQRTILVELTISINNTNI